jgi:lysozyme
VSRLREILLREEGLELKPYLCSRGKITIAVGRNLEDRGITTDEAFFLLDNDIKRFSASAATFEWYPKLDPVRKDVVVAMIFQMGLDGFCEFRRTIAAIAAKDYASAAAEMLNSKWAKKDSPERAMRMAQMMRTGVYP